MLSSFGIFLWMPCGATLPEPGHSLQVAACRHADHFGSTEAGGRKGMGCGLGWSWYVVVSWGLLEFITITNQACDLRFGWGVGSFFKCIWATQTRPVLAHQWSLGEHRQHAPNMTRPLPDRGSPTTPTRLPLARPQTWHQCARPQVCWSKGHCHGELSLVAVFLHYVLNWSYIEHHLVIEYVTWTDSIWICPSTEIWMCFFTAGFPIRTQSWSLRLQSLHRDTLRQGIRPLPILQRFKCHQTVAGRKWCWEGIIGDWPGCSELSCGCRSRSWRRCQPNLYRISGRQWSMGSNSSFLLWASAMR